MTPPRLALWGPCGSRAEAGPHRSLALAVLLQQLSFVLVLVIAQGAGLPSMAATATLLATLALLLLPFRALACSLDAHIERALSRSEDQEVGRVLQRSQLLALLACFPLAYLTYLYSPRLATLLSTDPYIAYRANKAMEVVGLGLAGGAILLLGARSQAALGKVRLSSISLLAIHGATTSLAVLLADFQGPEGPLGLQGVATAMVFTSVVGAAWLLIVPLADSDQRKRYTTVSPSWSRADLPLLGSLLRGSLLPALEIFASILPILLLALAAGRGAMPNAAAGAVALVLWCVAGGALRLVAPRPTATALVAAALAALVCFPYWLPLLKGGALLDSAFDSLRLALLAALVAEALALLRPLPRRRALGLDLIALPLLYLVLVALLNLAPVQAALWALALTRWLPKASPSLSKSVDPPLPIP